MPGQTRVAATPRGLLPPWRLSFTLTDQSQLQSLASVTGRVGYAADRLLGYVKAGAAWQQSNYSLLVGGATAATAGETRDGWTLGVGGEYAFLDWLTGFVEYDY